MISPLRSALGAHLGQVLTPEIAALIEQAAFALSGNTEPELMTKWRHLIEPTVQNSVTPIPWAQVLETPVNVMEAKDSVLVSLPPKTSGNRTSITIWIAAGDKEQVLGLFDQLTEHAKSIGIHTINYAGRRGWVRAAGFKEEATVGRKELIWVDL